MVEEAVAQATDTPIEDIRQANNRLGDLARVALAARHGNVQSIEARLFHPMDFMLAKPLDKLADLADPEDYIIEDKYDGIRSQVHVADGRAVIYTRGMGEVTGAFPELAESMQRLDRKRGAGWGDTRVAGWPRAAVHAAAAEDCAKTGDGRHAPGDSGRVHGLRPAVSRR